MNNLIKKILPTSTLQWLNKRKQKRLVKKLYKNDYNKFINYSFQFSNDRVTQKQLEAKIVFHYHAIEKGLSHINFRKGFGETALNALFVAMETYKKYFNPLDSLRYQTGLSVLKAYIRRHNELNYDVSVIEKRLELLRGTSKEEPQEIGGIFHYSKNDILQYAHTGFGTMAMNRFSVRDFGEETVPLETIKSAIQIAMKTPSVSNRQAWHVYIIKNQQLIKEVLGIQGGLKGHGQNIDSLLMITSDYTGLGDAGEYKQGHIDSGLFAMSLLYALTDKGIANCPLNADFHPEQDKMLRTKINVKDEEMLTMFIGIGSYPENNQIPKSQRDTIDQHIIIYD